jgi:hypothetical protein
MKTAVVHWVTGIQFGSRRSIAVLWLILLGAGVLTAVESIAKPLWYDEICTVVLCRLPGPSAIWKALENSADSAPPGFYLIFRLARQLVPGDHLGYRLLSILGLLGTVLCTYFILSRRVDYLAALVGASFVLCTKLADYGSEARAYALMVGCISGAILAWQRIDDSKLYSLLLAVALASAESLHYYAIFVWPAFVLAEATVWLVGRRFRAACWAALLVGASPLLLFARLLLRMQQHYGGHYWGKPHFGNVFSDYDELFNAPGLWGWTLIAGLTVIFVYWSFRKTPWQGRQTAGGSGLPTQECVLIVTLLWLPVMAIALATIGHAGMTPRYMLPTILGGALAVGCLASRLSPSLRGLLLILLLMNFVLVSLRNVWDGRKGSLAQQQIAADNEVRAIVAQDPQPDLPVVISSGHQYLQMAYYTPSDSNRKLYGVVDPPAAVKYAGSDIVDLNLLVISRYFPLQVEDYGRFASRFKEFLLVSNGDIWDWWPVRLSQDGHALRLLSQTGNVRVYKVTSRQGDFATLATHH